MIDDKDARAIKPFFGPGEHLCALFRSVVFIDEQGFSISPGQFVDRIGR